MQLALSIDTHRFDLLDFWGLISQTIVVVTILKFFVVLIIIWRIESKLVILIIGFQSLVLPLLLFRTKLLPYWVLCKSV